MFLAYLKTIIPCEITRTVCDNEYIGEGLRVIFTPGHTAGHISLMLEVEDDKIIFAGDALAFENGKLEIANPQFTLDMDKCKKSIEKIKALSPNKIICYHGGIIKENVDSLLDELLKKEVNAIGN